MIEIIAWGRRAQEWQRRLNVQCTKDTPVREGENSQVREELEVATTYGSQESTSWPPRGSVAAPRLIARRSGLKLTGQGLIQLDNPALALES